MLRARPRPHPRRPAVVHVHDARHRRPVFSPMRCRSCMTPVVTDVTLERLRAIPLFAELGEETLQWVAASCSELEVPEGHTVVQPREPATGFFLIEDGTARVELRDKRRDLGRGDFFGELALLVPGETRSARVRSTSRVRLLCIDRAAFEQLVATEPGIGLGLARSLARRLLHDIPS